METDYEDVKRRILSSGDEHAIEAYDLGRGIRILRQDLWEMIITFLISQNNNITRITRSVEEICTRHGDALIFPRPEEFDLEILKDKSIGLGYRVPYIENAVKVFRESDQLLTELAEMTYEEAYETLIKFTGIGPKVANCICLFGLHHIEAFPIDTHVKQLLDKYYPDGFPYDKYEGIAGIIQQYLFYYELKHK
jgi:N-glycosylase/DNA lyase